jgi:hypothetical protein
VTLPIEEARAACDEITAAGVRATVDPRKAVPPCLVIGPPQVSLDRLDLCGTADWTAHLIAATGAGTTDAWSQLDSLVGVVLGILPVETIRPTDYSPDGTTEYPAYELTWTAQVDYQTP